jgi:hypothetical protein
LFCQKEKGNAKAITLLLNPFSAEPVLQMTLFSLARTWVHSYAIIYWTKFLTMKRQDGRLQFDHKRNNLRSYTHSQLRLEQANLAIA